MLRKLLFVAVLAGLVGILSPSCKVSYSFTGANLSPEVKTFTVYYFPNRARLVNPTLSQNFTEKLREKLTRQTSLNELSESGDLEFQGEITGYELKPMSVQKADVVAQTRLTITIKLKYTNNKVTEDNFEKSFSAYEDFDSNLSISSEEERLSTEIIEKLTEDIFNATIANW
nr:LptE family protein [uncultured Draconibacterium sp.]